MIVLVALAKSKSIALPAHVHPLVLAPGDHGRTPKHVKGKKADWVRDTMCDVAFISLPYLSFSLFYTSS